MATSVRLTMTSCAIGPRLTNGHSEKVANHSHMVALYILFYNFIRTHGKLRMTLAMQAQIATTFLTFEDVLVAVDAAQIPKARGSYKKRELSNGGTLVAPIQLPLHRELRQRARVHLAQALSALPAAILEVQRPMSLVNEFR